MTPKIMKDSNSVSEPPLADSYQSLHELENKPHYSFERDHEVVGECELPLINLTSLRSGSNGRERRACAEAMAKASSEWGFFQVVNHGISQELLKEMKQEQVKLFRLPFEAKVASKLLNDSYRWGMPTATSAKQFSWSEAFHVPLAKISEDSNFGEFSSLREVMEKLAVAMSELARTLAGVLAENLGYSESGAFPENCDESTCFLRLNRYPPCPFAPGTFGLMPHTDSDFLTILYQDQVGGLQLMKGSKWVAVKPIPGALIVNIGDLEHLFFSCTFAKALWQRLLSWMPACFATAQSDSRDLSSWWSSLRASLSGATKDTLDTCFAAVCWGLWKERNARLFNNQLSSIAVLENKVLAEAEFWLITLRPNVRQG